MTTHASSTARDEMPVGRAEVAAAILEAAADLFATRGPATTSIRDIARRAHVNHGLVFRHFGTKEHLVGAVLDHLGMTATTLLQAGAPTEQVEQAADRQLRVTARTLLDGYPAGQLQTRFPGIERFLEQVRPRHDSDHSARLAVANAVALQVGWGLFGPFLRAAAGIEDVPETELRQAVRAEISRLVEPQ